MQRQTSTMNIAFSKMHGLGNDFMVIDAINQDFHPDQDLTADLIQQWSDRRFGIGFDQLLIVEPPDSDAVDFRYRIYNADGGEVEQCGNGARCFARFVTDHGLTSKTSIPVSTTSGIIVLHMQKNGDVQVDMGPARFQPADIPIKAELQDRYILTLPDRAIEIGAVSMGNPHAVMLTENIDTAAVETIGPAVESHELFPERTNVGFMQIMNRQHIRLRVFERGAGETLACGTGACAAAAVGRHWGLLDEDIQVSLPGGDLQIHWAGQDSHVLMTGPAVEVFQAHIEIDKS